MKRINTHIVKERSRRLTKLFEGFTPYTHLVGQQLKVWFNTETSEDGRHSVGHTKAYVKVLVPLDHNLPGRSRMVDIHSCQRFHIEGTVSAVPANAQSSLVFPHGGICAGESRTPVSKPTENSSISKVDTDTSYYVRIAAVTGVAVCVASLLVYFRSRRR